MLLFQYKREKDFKLDQIEISLNNIAELAYNYIERKGLENDKDLSSLDSLYLYIPDDNIRVTILNKSGKVLYDSEVKQVMKMENHLHRPEIQKP